MKKEKINDEEAFFKIIRSLRSRKKKEPVKEPEEKSCQKCNVL